LLHMFKTARVCHLFVFNNAEDKQVKIEKHELFLSGF